MSAILPVPEESARVSAVPLVTSFAELIRTLKDSAFSTMVSSRRLMVTSTLVCPAGISTTPPLTPTKSSLAVAVPSCVL